ncbi:MAG: rhomboid family intramembrane serine protease [Planctomycetales bacterium]|nr:rhomboid family intramembrane serine protease [Planctomycetales bacterium]
MEPDVGDLEEVEGGEARFPLATAILVVATTLVSAATISSREIGWLSGARDFFLNFRLEPGDARVPARLWTFGTSLFLHTNVFHLMLTLALLCYAGPVVERAWGRLKFWGFYVAAAAASGLASVAWMTWGAPEGPGPATAGGVGPGLALLLGAAFLAPDALPFVRLRSAILTKLAGFVAVLSLFGVLLALEVRGPDITWSYTGHVAGPLLALLVFYLAPSVRRARRVLYLRRGIATLLREQESRARVEQLLEKIARDGMTSLSSSEKRFLRRASRFYGPRTPPEPIPGPRAAVEDEHAEWSP